MVELGPDQWEYPSGSLANYLTVFLGVLHQRSEHPGGHASELFCSLTSAGGRPGLQLSPSRGMRFPSSGPVCRQQGDFCDSSGS